MLLLRGFELLLASDTFGQPIGLAHGRQGLDVVYDDHNNVRLGPSSLRKQAKGAQGAADSSHGRDDGQGQ
jgi:hypothetical protein